MRRGDVCLRSRSRLRHSLAARFQVRAEFRRTFHGVRTHGRSGGANEAFTRKFRSSGEAARGRLGRNRQAGVGALRDRGDRRGREQSQGGSAVNLVFRLGGDDGLNLRSSRRLRLLLFRERGKKISRGQSVGQSQSVVCIFVRKQRERERRERRSTERTFVFFLLRGKRALFFSFSFSSPLSSFFCPLSPFSSALLAFEVGGGGSVPKKKQAKKKWKERKRFSHQSSGPYLWSEGETKKNLDEKIERHPILFCSHSLSFKEPLFLCWDLQSARTRALGKKVARACLSFIYFSTPTARAWIRPKNCFSLESFFFPPNARPE